MRIAATIVLAFLGPKVSEYGWVLPDLLRAAMEDYLLMK